MKLAEMLPTHVRRVLLLRAVSPRGNDRGQRCDNKVMLVSDVEDAVNLGLFEIIDFGFFEILATMNVLVIWNHYHPRTLLPLNFLRDQ